MPRQLTEYSFADWRRLRPLTHAWKTAAGAVVNARYCRAPAPEADAFARASARIRGKNVVATIAWNMPWVIRWHLKFTGAYLRGAQLVIADNSSDPRARAEIARLCAEAGVPYFALPANPYRDIRYASRSHGLALNWALRNIVHPAAPEVFGFLDHDILPTAPLDPAGLVEDRPVYGRLVVRGARWYLWPGYSFFRTDAVDFARMDFRQDWFAGLDTGGMNWTPVYSRLDRARLKFAHCRVETSDVGSGLTDGREWVDASLHLTNASEWHSVDAGRVARIEAMLARLWEECARASAAAPGLNAIS